jgi:hypothetical protein
VVTPLINAETIQKCDFTQHIGNVTLVKLIFRKHGPENDCNRTQPPPQTVEIYQVPPNLSLNMKGGPGVIITSSPGSRSGQGWAAIAASSGTTASLGTH